MSCHSHGSEKETSVPLFLLGGVLDHPGPEQAPVGAWFWIFLELLSDEHPVGVWHHSHMVGFFHSYFGGGTKTH